MRVRKAVIIAAGKGTRFLPVTRSLPKEMLPLVDRPIIQYVVEEVLTSGLSHIIMVTSRGKSLMEDYFDRIPELELFLEQKGDGERLEEMRRLSDMIGIHTVRQKEQLGLGHAVLTARDAVGDEPFAVLLPDDLIDGETPCLARMMAIYERYGGSVIAVQRVRDEDTRRYGIVTAEMVAEKLYRVTGLVEKPAAEDVPSRLAIVGRYILSPQIFDAISVTPPGKAGEIQLTDALEILLQKEAVYAFEFDGDWYDTGTPLGWLRANLAFALKRPDIAPELEEYLKGMNG
ncbi:MAG: UTP--glucose-1-phosphate uridylyltransferase GalU [Dehalococcoidales bacterium]|nr:UTP--glucose-1-phosphate uridylyltransferase GalU [Dehalococcoidales bacterium]